MKALDIYLSSLTHEEYQNLKPNLGTRNSKPMPLLSWDIFMDGYHQRMSETKKRTELEQVLSFAKRFNWRNDLERAFSENAYEALIITDKHQKIIWVNEGFSIMTGYSKSLPSIKHHGFYKENKRQASQETELRIKSPKTNRLKSLS